MKRPHSFMLHLGQDVKKLTVLWFRQAGGVTQSLMEEW